MPFFGISKTDRIRDVSTILSQESTDSGNSNRAIASRDESSVTRVMGNRLLDDESEKSLMMQKFRDMTSTSGGETIQNQNKCDKGNLPVSEVNMSPSSPPVTELFCDQRSQISSSHKAMVLEPEENRGTWIMEQPESFESIDSSNWPSSWNQMLLTKREKLRHRRRSKVICITSMLILLCTILVFVFGYNKKVEKEMANVRTTSSAVAQTPSTDNIFEEEEEIRTSIPEKRDDLQTLPPTTAPTSNRETCLDMIRADRRCYNQKDQRDEPFTIGFVRCESHRENWMGIYPAGLDPESLPDPLMWAWTCDSEDIVDCNDQSTLSGTLSVAGSLETGFYQAHLMERDGRAPYSAFVSSDVFQVSKDCTL